MKRMSIALVIVSILILNFLTCTDIVFAQTGGGDQFLDGIGETAMVARYVLNGNAEDWSRNNYHADVNGTEASYVEDEMFGSVLSLAGNSFVQIPGQALNGVEAISITSWVYINEPAAIGQGGFMRGTTRGSTRGTRRGNTRGTTRGNMRGFGGARFFEFGRDRNVSFYCSTSGGGRNTSQGYSVGITTGGRRSGQAVAAESIEPGKWVHLAIVLDTANKTLSCYCNGVKVGQTTDVTLSMDKIINQEDTAANLLYIGRGISGGAMNAKIHDFRIYNIPLTDEQVRTIRNNALTDEVRVKNDLASIDLDVLTDRVTDLTLPTEGSMGSSIAWQSDTSNVVTTAGKLTRPPSTYNGTHATVTLTAKASLNQADGSKTFVVTVPRMPSDREVVDSDKQDLELGELSALKDDISLPVEGTIGASIKWASDNEQAISTTGKVNRPAPGTGDANVKLTATITEGAVTDVKEFNATVIAMPTDKQIVDSDLAQINLQDIDNLINNITLSTESLSGLSTISWASSNEAVISKTGEVTRPPFEEGSKTVTLTVTAVKDNTSASKTFAATVRRLPDAPILVEVPDITVETVVGDLPHLPYYVPGKYRDNKEGSLVRVNWPAPTNNNQVMQQGTYTVTGTVAGTDFLSKATVNVKAATATVDMPNLNLEPFSLGQVILNQDENGNDTQFIKNRDKFILTLAQTNPDSFLFNFRDAFGQQQPAGVRPLGGWDSRTTRLRGHASGHYLSAIAQAYASTTYDEDLHAIFLQKMNYMIDTLYDLSQKSGKPVQEGGEFNADPTKVPPGPGRNGYDSDLSANGIRTDYYNWGEGFISAYPPDQFIMLENGATYGGSNSQIWAPYYTLHKILAGLLDCYEVGGNEKALQIAKGMGTWVYERLKVVPTETRISMWNRYIAGEYGGMNEVMARLNRLTGDKKFLDCAQLFDNINFFFGDIEHDHGLARNVDTLRGKHANQHIPQITGALETYRDTHDIEYFDVAENFWDISRNSYMYSIGGVAGARNPNNSECFTVQPNTLFENGFNNGGQNETCATYNMLKLSRQLFMFDQNTKYMDYYEQALYNDILASVAENNAGNTYHIPLNPASRKSFGNANMSGFTCCNGTALESSTKLQDSIYFKSTDNKALYVNLYVPSTVNWKERNVTVKQSTNFPYADTTRLVVSGSGEFEIKVRVPEWATQGFIVKINGQDKALKANPGTYLSLGNTWKDNDTIELKMPFHFYLRPVMDQPNIASVFYGPVLLAAQESQSLSTWRPLSLDASDIGKSFTGDPGSLTFNIDDVTFKPFYESYNRYSVYFDVTLD